MSTRGETEHMRSFWDERARENALYFVDSTLHYRHPDADRFWASGAEALDTLLAHLGMSLKTSDRVLDLGCGVGRLSRQLSARVAHVYALDVSGEMLTRARELNPGLDNVEWLQGDGATLAPIPEASLDVCLSWVVFQHIPDPEVILGYVREMSRVLRPGGWAGFQISDNPIVHQRPGPARRAAARIAARLGRAPQGRDDPAWRGSAVGLDVLRETTARVGLDVERVEHAGTQYCLVLVRRRDDAPAPGVVVS